jgi:DNA-binding MarR family transcriptional regulator
MKSFTHLITKVSSKYRTEFSQTLASNGFSNITPDYFIVLEWLWEEDNISIGQLAKRTDKDNASLSRILDGMERNDLVRRIPSETDKRSYFIILSKYSKELKDKLSQIEAKILEKSTQGLNPIEVKELIRMLNHLFVRLDQ